MKNFRQNILDRLIDEFACRDLKKRVWAAIFIGISLCIAASFAAYFFLTSVYEVKPGIEMSFLKMLWIGK